MSLLVPHRFTPAIVSSPVARKGEPSESSTPNRVEFREYLGAELKTPFDTTRNRLRLSKGSAACGGKRQGSSDPHASGPRRCARAVEPAKLTKPTPVKCNELSRIDQRGPASNPFWLSRVESAGYPTRMACFSTQAKATCDPRRPHCVNRVALLWRPSRTALVQSRNVLWNHHESLAGGWSRLQNLSWWRRNLGREREPAQEACTTALNLRSTLDDQLTVDCHAWLLNPLAWPHGLGAIMPRVPEGEGDARSSP